MINFIEGWLNVSTPSLIMVMLGLTIIFCCVIRRIVCRRQIVLRMFPFNAAALVSGYSYPRDIASSVLIMGAILSFFLALLRPFGSMETISLPAQSTDIMVLLDISKSMLAEDMASSRLDVAKKQIDQLVKALPHARFGLIVFANKPLLLCPLTQDHQTFDLFLRDISHETATAGGTALSDALAFSIDHMKGVTQGAALCVVFTDGEDFAHAGAETLSALKNEQISLFFVPVGTENGAPIPVYDDHGKRTGFLKDHRENVVISKVDVQKLSLYADALQGKVLPLDGQSAHSILVSAAQSRKIGMSQKMIMHDELYPYFAAISALLLCLEWLI
jgi:Ca-activated chloride channel homolog